MISVDAWAIDWTVNSLMKPTGDIFRRSKIQNILPVELLILGY